MAAAQMASRRGDEHIDSSGHRLDLRPMPTPPEYNRDREIEIAAVGAEALGNLGRKLSGGAEHQNPAALARGVTAVSCQALNDRHRECSGLAGARLGDAEYIARGENDGDGFGLDWVGVS